MIRIRQALAGMLTAIQTESKPVPIHPSNYGSTHSQQSTSLGASGRHRAFLSYRLSGDGVVGATFMMCEDPVESLPCAESQAPLTDPRSRVPRVIERQCSCTSQAAWPTLPGFFPVKGFTLLPFIHTPLHFVPYLCPQQPQSMSW